VMIWDDLQKKVVIELKFSTDVTCVRLRRDRIVVVLNSFIKVYTFTTNPTQIHLFDTSPNIEGLCQLCPSSSNSILVFPGKTVGSVQVVNLEKSEGVSPLNIAAHDGPISCIALNLKGNQVATASDKGTLIRIFDTNTGDKLKELRRGSGNARIYCINFNCDSTMLCASSDHGTVHIFSLEEDLNSGGGSSSKNGSSNKFLPKYFNSVKSFCRFSLPTSTRSICAFTSDSASVIAICQDGTYYRFSFNLRGESTREYFAHFLEMTDNL